MKQTWCLLALLVGMLSAPARFEAADPAKDYASDDSLIVKTYAIADLIIPITAGDKSEPATGALERHLRQFTGPVAWKRGGSIQFYATTLSLVIRQTDAVHETIADELERLRRNLDVQTVLTIHVIDGTRAKIAELAEAFPGELGRYETDQLLDRVHDSNELSVVNAPKVTLFSKQTGEFKLDGRVIAANATVSEDRRSIRLKISEGPETLHDVLGNVEIVTIHDGRSVAIRFEAAVEGSIIPPANDAVERLLVVTPQLIVQEEEEELLGIQPE